VQGGHGQGVSAGKSLETVGPVFYRFSWRFRRRDADAQEIREYLEKHGIQNALTAAVNEAIQAKATNPLEFIGDLLKSKGGSAGAGGAVQLPPGGAGEQIVQAAAYSTMVSHQVACFVDAGSEAGAKAAAEKDAAAALIQNAAARA